MHQAALQQSSLTKGWAKVGAVLLTRKTALHCYCSCLSRRHGRAGRCVTKHAKKVAATAYIRQAWNVRSQNLPRVCATGVCCNQRTRKWSDVHSSNWANTLWWGLPVCTSSAPLGGASTSREWPRQCKPCNEGPPLHTAARHHACSWWQVEKRGTCALRGAEGLKFWKKARRQDCCPTSL